MVGIWFESRFAAKLSAALILHLPSNTPLAREGREAQTDMDGGTPIEMARQKLFNTGLSRDLVEQAIAQAAGLNRKQCPHDRLTYRAIVQRYAQCGAPWEPALQ